MFLHRDFFYSIVGHNFIHPPIIHGQLYYTHKKKDPPKCGSKTCVYHGYYSKAEADIQDEVPKYDYCSMDSNQQRADQVRTQSLRNLIGCPFRS